MNRTERRRQAKQSEANQKTYNLTQDQITQIKKEAIDDAFRMLICIPVVVLSDWFQLDSVDLDKFTYRCFSWVEGIQKGEVSLAEIQKICEEEAGIKITTKNK